MPPKPGMPPPTLLAPASQTACYSHWPKVSVALRLALTYPWADRAILALVRDDMPVLSLYDQNEKPRLGLSITRRRPSVGLYDENGKTRAVLGHTELETTATGTVEQRPASSLVLFNKAHLRAHEHRGRAPGGGGDVADVLREAWCKGGAR